jgi:hypothetical protein
VFPGQIGRNGRARGLARYFVLDAGEFGVELLLLGPRQMPVVIRQVGLFLLLDRPLLLPQVHRLAGAEIALAPLLADLPLLMLDPVVDLIAPGVLVAIGFVPAMLAAIIVLVTMFVAGMMLELLVVPTILFVLASFIRQDIAGGSRTECAHKSDNSKSGKTSRNHTYLQLHGSKLLDEQSQEFCSSTHRYADATLLSANGEQSKFAIPLLRSPERLVSGVQFGRIERASVPLFWRCHVA